MHLMDYQILGLVILVTDMIAFAIYLFADRKQNKNIKFGKWAKRFYRTWSGYYQAREVRSKDHYIN